MKCGRMLMFGKSLVLALMMGAAFAGPALALDGTDTPASIKPTLPLYKNSLHALNQAIEGLRAGDAARLQPGDLGGDVAHLEAHRGVGGGLGVGQDPQHQLGPAGEAVGRLAGGVVRPFEGKPETALVELLGTRGIPDREHHRDCAVVQ